VERISVEDIRDVFERSPFNQHVGLEMAYIEDGKLTVELAVDPKVTNVNGTVHGGVYATMLDVVFGMTIRSLAKCPLTTVNLNIHYLAPSQDGRLIATAKILQQGYRLWTAEGEITDQQGKLLAKGMGTFKIMRSKQS
jgi:uncharacterized protein (TIGR00369 family)